MNPSNDQKRIKIVALALRHWDPIGIIKDLIEDRLPPDEYGSYAPNVYSHVRSAKDFKDIANQLVFIRITNMELGINRPSEHEQDIAKKLIIWRDGGYAEIPDFTFDRYRL